MAKTHRSPDGMFASDGAVKQEGLLHLYVCNACHGYVVWATSRKTDRKYLANVRRGYLDQRYYVKHDVHTAEQCERRQQNARELEAYFQNKAKEPQMHDAGETEQPYAEDYCSYCERDGHTLRTCPERDDYYAEEDV